MIGSRPFRMTTIPEEKAVLSAVQDAVNTIQKAFPDSKFAVTEDGAGGAFVIVETVDLGAKFTPAITWIGGHVPPQVPYADVYPLFIGGEVRFSNGTVFVPPINVGHNFQGRPATMISRKTNRLDPTLQTPACKFQKVLYWLINTP
jgi:hypothetical protein